MFKFFRKIRRNLINKKRFGNYILYAIGEIILVVIGILIALQINEWNSNNKARKAEQAALKNLYQEFHSNQEALEEQRTLVMHVIDANKSVMSLFNKEREILKHINTDSIIYHSLEFDRFSPSENVVQDLLQSGRLNLLSNDNLRNQLFNWTRVLKTSEERYIDCNLKIVDEIAPYLTQHYSFKDLDHYGGLNWDKKSEFKIDKLAVFEDIVYENLTDDFLYRLERYSDQMDKLDAIISDIKNQTQ